jgi:hypothetical protein
MMQVYRLWKVALVSMLVAGAWAQSPFMPPAYIGEKVSYTLDTGWVKAEQGDQPQKVYETVIYYEGAHSMRLYFEEAHLSPGSWIEVRSLYDNEVQRLDSSQLALWRNKTAFFNGNALLLTLYCAPGATARLVIRKIWIDRGGNPNESDFNPAACTACGRPLCGGCSERQPACVQWTGDCNALHGRCQQWAGRIIPIGCSASVISRAGCVISAGHCFDIPGDPLDYVIQFNVPASLPNCAIQHPPVADQFPPIDQVYYFNWSLDWAVIVLGPNSEGQLPYERYGQLRRPVPYDDVAVGQPVGVYGYGRWTADGINEGCRNYTLQYDDGQVVGSFGAWISANVEVDQGNSGSGLLRLSDQRIIGVVMTCGGSGTKTSYWEFVRARRMLCPTPGDVNEDGIVDDADFLMVLFAFGQECPLFCIEDQNDDGMVDDGDLLIVLFNFGNQY